MLFERLFGRSNKPQPVEPSQKNHGLSDGEYESLFMQLLDRVDQGWSRGQVKGFLMAKGTTEADLVVWLQDFGRRLLESPEPNYALGRRLVKLAEVGCGKLGEVAQDFGNHLLARESLSFNPSYKGETQGGENITVEADSVVAVNVSTEKDAIALFNQGLEQLKASKYNAALASFDRSLALNSKDPKVWDYRGFVLQNLGRDEEAIASYNFALTFNPNNTKARHNRDFALQIISCQLQKLGIYTGDMIADHEKELLSELRTWLKASGHYKEAIASNNKKTPSPLELQEATTWVYQGVEQIQLGRYEEAVVYFDRAIALNPDSFDAWYYRGAALGELGRWERNIELSDSNCLLEAIASGERALTINPNSDNTWHSVGNALWHLGYAPAAVPYLERAIALNPNNRFAWHMRGVALRTLGRLEEAVTSFDRALTLVEAQRLTSWYDRGWAILLLWGYKPAVQSYDDGLLSLQPDKPGYQETCQTLHRAKGDIHYQEGRQQQNPFPYWLEARKSYQAALQLQTKTTGKHGDEPLAVLQNLIIVCRTLGQTKEAQELLREGTDLLQRLLQDTPSPGRKLLIAQHFAGFNQLRVDELVQSGELLAALELAEERKNNCLSWLRYSWSDAASNSPKYQDIQKLLNSHTAIVYWHISPAAITTFILRDKQPPVLLSPEPMPDDATYLPFLRQLVEFENWIETWKKDYQNYRPKPKQENDENRRDTQETSVSSSEQKRWLEEMPERLKRLAEILNIEGILSHLKGVSQLILIPHRDLHLLPLHALFPDNFTITYLPSIKVGLDRKEAKQNVIPQQPKISLLSVENPTDDRPYATLESDLISQLYPNSQRLPKSAATPDAVKQALSKGIGIFHFTGHGEHDINQPAQSALILANEDKLTVRNILQLDLSGCNLACLSACETNFTSKVGLIDEFVGLASAFVAAGVNNVVGSLWNVNDLSTAYLMTKFHEILRTSDTDVASALKQAQYLLRNVTNKELQEWRKTLPSQESQERSLRGITKKTHRETEANVKPFASPYYWAAFCAIGL